MQGILPTIVANPHPHTAKQTAPPTARITHRWHAATRTGRAVTAAHTTTRRSHRSKPLLSEFPRDCGKRKPHPRTHRAADRTLPSADHPSRTEDPLAPPQSTTPAASACAHPANQLGQPTGRYAHRYLQVCTVRAANLNAGRTVACNRHRHQGEWCGRIRATHLDRSCLCDHCAAPPPIIQRAHIQALRRAVIPSRLSARSPCLNPPRPLRLLLFRPLHHRTPRHRSREHAH